MIVSDVKARWICLQLGAREHYAIPRALHSADSLELLITDAWVRPENPLARCKRSLRERYHPQLSDSNVLSANISLLTFEAFSRARNLSGWRLIMARNAWFQGHALVILKRLERQFEGAPMVVFAYSYAAREVFRWAKSCGFHTVLGQIDAGPEMVRIVQRLEAKYPNCKTTKSTAPTEYWDGWREECDLADDIVVNSNWSKCALRAAGIQDRKIRVIPLAYSFPTSSLAHSREYPTVFNRERPLRILFLGQVNLAKGIMSVLECSEMLKDQPVEFHVVGKVHLNIPDRYASNSKIKWVGGVPRGAVDLYYRDADLFVFPSHSDGFGLTQLEAQAWKLPIIASSNCGDVVVDRVNGFRLKENTAESLAAAIMQCVSNPSLLTKFSRNSVRSDDYGLEAIGSKLEAIAKLKAN